MTSENTKNSGDKAQRNYKDRMFGNLFATNPEYTLSLVNALLGTNYSDPSVLKIVTLDDTFYCRVHNDLAVNIESWVSFFEHQSTPSENAAQRLFWYASPTYYQLYLEAQEEREQEIKAGKQLPPINIFSNRLVRMPAPKCFMLYNGIASVPERKVYRLSDAFLTPSPGYEWTVYMLNINVGMNAELMAKCPPLAGYSIFNDAIRRYQAQDNALEVSIKMAMDECIRRGVLTDYLHKHRGELFDMLVLEYDHDKALAMERQEGRYEGLEEGRAEGLAEGLKEGLEKGLEKGKHLTAVQNALAMLQDGLSFENVAKYSGLTLSEVQGLV